MSTQTYAGRLSPTVGNGLGGLPRREETGGGISWNVINSGVTVAFTDAGTYQMPFEIKDIRRVKFEVVLDSSQTNDALLDLRYNPQHSEWFVCDYNESTQLRFYVADTTSQITITPLSPSSLQVTKTGTLYAMRVRVVEYDFEVINSAFYNSINDGDVTITTPIIDLKKTIFTIKSSNSNIGVSSVFTLDEYTDIYWQKHFLSGDSVAGATNFSVFCVPSNILLRGNGYNANLRCTILQIK